MKVQTKTSTYLEKMKIFLFLALIVALVWSFLNVNPVFADGYGFLGQSNRFYLRGDVVSAGVGLRGVGRGDIFLSGIPAGATVQQAYLYWATLGSVNTYNSPTLNGTRVQGDLIGRSADTCWNVQNNFVFRADVTDLVDGNGTYTIAGLPDDVLDGNDSQGASLVVVYQDPDAGYRTITIKDGAVTLNFEKNTHTTAFSGYALSEPPVDAEITYLVGDGQTEYLTRNVTFYNEVIAQDVFTGNDGAYWDTLSFDVSELMVGSSATTTIHNSISNEEDSPDCLLWTATILSVSSPAPEESENELALYEEFELFGDVTTSGVGLRGRGEASLRVSGIPAGAEVEQAYLYWATLGSSSRFISPLLNNVPVEGEHIATSDDTCWGAFNNFVYRADVADLVHGNGAYYIDGLPNDLERTGNDSQGASLVVLYSGPANQYPRREITIHDGAVTLDFETHTYTDRFTGVQTDDPTTEARLTYLIGDGQLNWEAGSVTVNDDPIAYNVFTGIDGDYWGSLSFDVTALVDGPTMTTVIDNNIAGNEESPDCLLWAGTVLTVTTP